MLRGYEEPVIFTSSPEKGHDLQAAEKDIAPDRFHAVGPNSPGDGEACPSLNTLWLDRRRGQDAPRRGAQYRWDYRRDDAAGVVWIHAQAYPGRVIDVGIAES